MKITVTHKGTSIEIEERYDGTRTTLLRYSDELSNLKSLIDKVTESILKLNDQQV